MKIAAQHPPQVPRTGPATAEPSARSFGELIESGASARTIAGTRAMGFAETGLMGLRFATGAADESARSVSPARAGPEPIAMCLEDASLVEVSAAKRPGSVAASHQPQRDEGRPGRTAVRGQSSVLAPSTDAADATVASTLAPESKVASESAFGARLLRHVRLQFPSSKSFRITLQSGNDGIDVSIDNLVLDDDELLDFERISRALAAEFGVTVSRVLVKYSPGLQDVRPTRG